MRILSIENDPGCASSLETLLVLEGFSVRIADTGQAGISLAQSYEYDCILLELTLPDTHGLDVLRSLRRSRVTTPVVILSGQMEVKEQVACFDAGADACITKPFCRELLIAHIRAIMRRSHTGTNGSGIHSLRVGELNLNVRTKTLEAHGRAIDLTRLEYELLHTLMLHADTVLSRKAIMSSMYGTHPPVAQTLNVHIVRIRKKIADAVGGKEYVHTVRGLGYMLRAPEDHET